jgi:hypothetical protein
MNSIRGIRRASSAMPPKVVEMPMSRDEMIDLLDSRIFDSSL